MPRISDDEPEFRDAILKDLGRLEKWAHVNQLKFSKAVCKLFHLGRGNPRYMYRTN